MKYVLDVFLPMIIISFKLWCSHWTKADFFQDMMKTMHRIRRNRKYYGHYSWIWAVVFNQILWHVLWSVRVAPWQAFAVSGTTGFIDCKHFIGYIKRWPCFCGVGTVVSVLKGRRQIHKAYTLDTLLTVWV